MNFTHWVDAINEYVAANASHPIVTVVMWALSVIDGIFPVVPSESVVVALAAIGQPPVVDPHSGGSLRRILW